MEELSKYVFIGKQDHLKYFFLTDDHFNEGILNDKVAQYIKSEDIFSLTMSYTDNFNQSNTLFLQKLSWIKNVIIIQLQLNLAGLKFLPNLEKIFVAENNNEPINFSPFLHLKNVELNWTNDRRSLLRCKSIENLKLYHYREKNFANFTQLVNLQVLTVITSSFADLNGVENLPDLEVFEMHYNSKIADFFPLTQCKKLKKLIISHCSKITDLSFLRDCSELEFLNISDCKNIQNNDAIFDLLKLKVLGYFNSGSIQSIKEITNLKFLERFNIYNTEIKDAILEPLLDLPKLIVCEIRNKKHYTLTNEEIQSKVNINYINSQSI